ELRREGLVAPDPVQGSVARRRDEPRGGVRRHSVAPPPFRGDREGLLRGFLGDVEVAEEADQRREDAPPLLAEGVFQLSYHCTVGRTSTAPPRRAAGIFAARSIAASRSSASKTRYPPIASLISTNGPSVVSVLPSWTRTVVAVVGSSRPRPGVAEDHRGRVPPGHPHDAAARMRAAAAEVEVLDGRPVVAVARDRAEREELIRSELALHDVAAEKPVALLDVLRCQDLQMLDG